MQSYRPEELFDADGTLRADIAALAPQGTRRMSANPHANGGLLLKNLASCPTFATTPCRGQAGRGRCRGHARAGEFLRDVMRLNAQDNNFRVMGPDETSSNRLGACSRSPTGPGTAEILPGDDHLAPDGRVMEVLSEHLCQGWLEGYLLTGRHGFFSCYEAFIHIVDSMFNQHAKWLKVTRHIGWRRPSRR
jgi:xylulose-5-phosphate/fructose-6-phosphate phosphoketolase